jgi:hypothetical protein
MATNHVNFLTFNGFRPLNVTFQTKPFKHKALFGQQLQKLQICGDTHEG